jgi:formate dehydrogenase subunit gamma
MFFGVILLLVSGSAVVRGVHSVEPALAAVPGCGGARGAALLTIGAFIIHVYMGTAMVRGGFTSIIRGEVSPEWAKTHHRLWYEQVTETAPAGNDSIQVGPTHPARG